MSQTQVLFLFLNCLIGISPLAAQDHGGNQFSNTPLYFNPAYSGLDNGFRVRLATLNQGPGLETPFRAYHLTADVAGRSLPGS